MRLAAIRRLPMSGGLLLSCIALLDEISADLPLPVFMHQRDDLGRGAFGFEIGLEADNGVIAVGHAGQSLGKLGRLEIAGCDWPHLVTDRPDHAVPLRFADA